jgi:hypothetical protein
VPHKAGERFQFPWQTGDEQFVWTGNGEEFITERAWLEGVRRITREPPYVVRKGDELPRELFERATREVEEAKRMGREVEEARWPRDDFPRPMGVTQAARPRPVLVRDDIMDEWVQSDFKGTLDEYLDKRRKRQTRARLGLGENYKTMSEVRHELGLAVLHLRDNVLEDFAGNGSCLTSLLLMLTVALVLAGVNTCLQLAR